jgi:hypothetical protein
MDAGAATGQPVKFREATGVFSDSGNTELHDILHGKVFIYVAFPSRWAARGLN